MSWSTIFVLGVAFVAGFAIASYFINRAGRDDTPKHPPEPPVI
jgi:hypothetical protein